MRFSPVAAILALVLSAGTWAEEPVVWRIDQTREVGGHPVAELLGAPRVVDGALEFDGKGDGLFLDVNPLAGRREFTVEVQFRPAGDGPEAQRFVHLQDGTGSRLLFETRLDGQGRWWLDTFLWNSSDRGRGSALIDPTLNHPTDRWYWGALTYDGKRMTSYVNGVPELAADYAFGPMEAGRTSLGVRQNKVYWFKGRIRELRFHARVLRPEELQRE